MSTYAYIRVSTQDQSENGSGLEIQERALRERFELAELFRDEGISGGNGLETRTGLSDALAILQPGDVLAVYRLDRFARDFILQETLLGIIKRKGAQLVSLDQAENDALAEETPSRVFVRQILGAVAQYERATIRARMRAGRAAKKAKGLPAGGPPPYGYVVRGGVYVKDEYEQMTIAKMLELRRKKCSYVRIADLLTEAKIYFTRQGNPWAAGSVHRVVRQAKTRTK